MNNHLSEESKKLLEILNRQIEKLRGQVDFIKYKNNFEYAAMCDKYISAMFKYCIILRDDVGVEEYLELKTDEEREKYLEKRIAEKLNIPEESIPTRKKDILEFAYTNYNLNGFLFHSTNSYSISQIEKKGFIGGDSESWNRADIDAMNALVDKYEPNQSILKIAAVQSNGWYYNDNASQILYYSTNGPEWFGRMCGNCIDYHYIVPKEDKNAFERRDYDTALRNIETYMKKHNFSEEDRVTYLGYFNKYWEMYGKSEPSLLLIPRMDVLKDHSFEESYLNYRAIFHGEPTILSMCGDIFTNYVSNDKVYTDDIISVDILPLFPELEKRFRVEREVKEAATNNIRTIERDEGQSVNAFKEEMSSLLLKIASLPAEDRKKVEELVNSLIQKNKQKENGLIDFNPEDTKKPTDGWGYDD